MRGGLTTTVVVGILNAVLFVGPAGPSFELTGLDVARIAALRRRRGGHLVPHRFAALVPRSAHGSVAELGAMASDIERRDERLELVLAASGTGFWEWDIRGGKLTWSEAIYRQHGSSRREQAPTFEEYLGTIHPDDRATFRSAVDEALTSGTSFSLEFRLLWPDGSIHWTHGVGRVFRDARGEPIRMVGTGTDITERRRLEAERDGLLLEERRAGAFREAFVDVISHELRTPITTIFGLTQILNRPGRQTDPTQQSGLIDDISAEAERLHRLVEDLLVLTRAERGEFAIESEPLELRRLLTRIVEREARRLPRLSISTELPPDLPVVAGEDTYVEQIVRNILSNAAKYTPVGTAVIVQAEHVGDVVEIRVLDAGPGIDADASDRAFELFYRAPGSARTWPGRASGCSSAPASSRRWAARSGRKPRPEAARSSGSALRVLLDDESAGRAPSIRAGSIPGA